MIQLGMLRIGAAYAVVVQQTTGYALLDQQRSLRSQVQVGPGAWRSFLFDLLVLLWLA